MWHDTMLAGCRPVWDFSQSCITVKAQTSGSLKLNCCFKPKLKLKRGARAVPSVVSGGNISSSSSEWRNGGLGQPNQRGGSSLVWKSRTRKSPYVWQGVVVSIPAQDSRPVVMVSGSASSSLAVTMTAVVTKDMDISGLTNGEAGIQVYNNLTEREQEANLAESEKLRRHRISIANKGKVPWNKGAKHSAETIKRIREKTSLAMQNPTVVAKLRLNARHAQTNETKIKIRNKLRQRWDTKKRLRGYQEIMVTEWKNCVAEAARMGGLGEEEMEWNSYSVLKKKMRLDAAARTRSDKKEERARAKAMRPLKSEEHRLKIAAAIKAKWEDPEYQLKVKQGMVKSSNAIKKKRAPRRKASGDSATSEAGCIKGPLDHGFVTAVMLGEKKRQQKEDAAKEHKDESPAVSAAKTKLRARDRKVDLLKRRIVPAESESEDSEDDFTEELSVSAEHSFVDPHAGEKLFRLKLLQASRSVMDQRRREATHRAKVLMAKAEQAAKKLEATAGDNEFARASLAEIYRLMAEAELFIQAADSFHKDVEGTKSHNGALWRSTMAPYQSAKFQEQMTSKGEHGSAQGQDDDNLLSTNSEEIHQHDPSQQSEQDIAMCIKTVSTIPESAQVMMFGNEVRGNAVWRLHNPFTDELQCKSRFPSTVGLLNGSSSRKMGAMKETVSCLSNPPM